MFANMAMVGQNDTVKLEMPLAAKCWLAAFFKSQSFYGYE